MSELHQAPCTMRLRLASHAPKQHSTCRGYSSSQSPRFRAYEQLYCLYVQHTLQQLDYPQRVEECNCPESPWLRLSNASPAFSFFHSHGTTQARARAFVLVTRHCLP